MRRIFDAYDVHFHPVMVYCKNYPAAWRQVIGAIQTEMLGIQLEIDKDEFKIAHAYKNICVSQSATSTNDSRCWLNIGVDKLKSAVEQNVNEWYFDCLIEGRRYSYVCSVKKLYEAFVKEENKVGVINNNTERYSFYLDYQEGMLYASVVRSDNRPILSLTPCRGKFKLIQITTKKPAPGKKSTSKKSTSRAPKKSSL